VKELRQLIGAVRRAAAEHESLALATLVRVRGSSYRRPGARLLVGPDGPRLGSLSGGCLEADAALRASETLRTGAPRLLSYDLRGDHDLVWGHGLGCEGVAEVLVEPLPTGDVPAWLAAVERRLAERRRAYLSTVVEGDRLGERALLDADAAPPECVVEAILPQPALWIFGAGEDARPLVAIAAAAGFVVGVVDPRPALLTRARFPEAERIEGRHPGDGVAGLGLDERSAAVLLTHHYQRDREWLAALLPSRAAYLGVLGPRRRSARLVAELGRPLSALERARLYAPVGLDLGAESPAEIALAIVAEAQAVLSGRRGRSLREKPGALHPRIEERLAWPRVAIS
jgi:xanthine/CO dehydrogenase XdhC/CoxF family maturation factor